MIKMVMDLLAWKNSLVITEETQVRKNGKGHERGNQKNFWYGENWMHLYFQLFTLDLQILRKIFYLRIVLFSGTGHSRLLISVCPLWIWWWFVCSPFHSFLASCFLFSERLK